MDAPMTTFYDLPELGEEVRVHTHFVVRDDAQLLFAFSDIRQRDLFRTLLKVSGVGPRVGLAILSTLSANEFSAAIANNDIARLTRVPGIGRKTAERLVVEMRDRLLQQQGDSEIPQPKVDLPENPVQDAVSALMALGYKPVEASRAVQTVASEGLSSEELIRQALRQLSGVHS